MNRARVFAALAAILTALLLQATIIAPVALPVPMSLPALLVAAVALHDGPGAGMSLGFAMGLLADLGSSHPAGVLALCWLGVGLVCGLAADDHATVRRDAAVAAMICAMASFVATVLMTVLGSGGATLWLAVRETIPAGLCDALLALAVVPVVRAFLRTDSLRAPRPAVTELRFGAIR